MVNFVRMLKRNHNRIIIAVRSATVTSVLLVALLTAIFFMGQSYSVMEKTAFGRDVEFLQMPKTDLYVFFGKEYNIPIITTVQRIKEFLTAYAPGTIKLLNYLFKTVKESWQLIVNLF